MKEKATELVMANDNNKLQCEGIVQIHFAPPRGSVRESDFDRIYYVKFQDQEIYMKLVDFARIPFIQIGTVLTLPATGMEGFEWRKAWLEKYPKTQPDTEMAVYCYKRLRE